MGSRRSRFRFSSLIVALSAAAWLPSGSVRASDANPVPQFARVFPGPYFGPRFSLATGLAFLPSALSRQTDLPERSASIHLAPYLGFDVGYASGGWGAGFTAEGSVLPLVPSRQLSPAFHGLLGVHVFRNHLLLRHSRWVFVLNWLDYVRTTNLYGDSFDSTGIGFRVGAHLPLKQWGNRRFEGFAYLCADRLARSSGELRGVDGSRDTQDFVGAELFSGMFYLLVGAQLNFAYPETE